LSPTAPSSLPLNTDLEHKELSINGFKKSAYVNNRRVKFAPTVTRSSLPKPNDRVNLSVLGSIAAPKLATDNQMQREIEKQKANGENDFCREQKVRNN